jgi:hypothetical protein
MTFWRSRLCFSVVTKYIRQVVRIKQTSMQGGTPMATFLKLVIAGVLIFILGKPAASAHWAFEPIIGPAIPDVKRSDLVRTPVDAFILVRLESEELSLSPQADRITLARRLALNLWGLPPSPEVVQRFTENTAPGAYEQLVETMLDSHHYGERWARHWLDVARFAESSGYVENRDWPHFWRYRDWVVQSFNQDKPFDMFVTQQLAGDELEPYADENIVATGFLAAARLATEELSSTRQENNMYVDIVNATSSALMGLTMACAQCHDHMFDPLTQREYYRLQAFFTQGYPGNLVLASSKVPEELHEIADQLTRKTLEVHGRILGEAYDEQPEQERRVLHASPVDRTSEEEALYRVRRAELNIRIAGCNAFRIDEEEKKELDRLNGELGKHQAGIAQTRGFYSPITSPHNLIALPMSGNFPLLYDEQLLGLRRCYLLGRGDPYQPQEPVEPGFPAVLDPNGTTVPADRPRTALAKWLTSSHHPLTARVWVNRIWSYHFGRGIVATSGNFGIRGARPTHPQLLDYLARELIDSGWSTKHVQRLILNSNTYRQQAKHDAHDARSDPENQLYWRWPNRRLEAEVIRDMMLAVAGRLDAKVGGPSEPAGQPSRRRSLYLFQKRDQPHEVAQLFDGPTEMSASCAARQVSTSALQPLYLLNSPTVAGLAGAFARSLEQAAPDDRRQQIELAFQRVLGRLPTEEERQTAADYLEYARSEPELENRRPRIVAVDLASSSQSPAAPPEAMVRPGLPDYILHYNGYADHTPDPSQGTVNYHFDAPETVGDVEMIVHVNGVTRIEGFAGNEADQLQSVGEATTTEAARGKPFPTERGTHVFRFDSDKVKPGRLFRFTVKETVKADGYANFQAYPRTKVKRRIWPNAELAPDVPQPLTPLAKFTQAMMSLNEFFYVP